MLLKVITDEVFYDISSCKLSEGYQQALLGKHNIHLLLKHKVNYQIKNTETLHIVHGNSAIICNR